LLKSGPSREYARLNFTHVGMWPSARKGSI
jgi:hypothetical protein